MTSRLRSGSIQNKHFDFSVLTQFGTTFADVSRGDLRLLLSGPASSAARPMADGTRPVPGGWNRIHLIVDDIRSEVDRLVAAGLEPRNDIVAGPGGSQVLFVDPVRQSRGAVSACRLRLDHDGSRYASSVAAPSRYTCCITPVRRAFMARS